MRRGIWVLVLPVVAAFLLFGSTAWAAQQNDVFNTVSFPTSDLGVLPQWQDALERLRGQEMDALRRCDENRDCASAQMADWRSEISSIKKLPVDKRMISINRFVNKLPPLGGGEPPLSGEPWPGIQETLEGQGGAIGKAIIKYLSLRDCGFAAADVRIVIGQDVFSGSKRVFMLVRVNGSQYVLDQLSASPRKVDEVNNLLPLYSFNEEKVWLHMPYLQETSP